MRGKIGIQAANANFIYYTRVLCHANERGERGLFADDGHGHPHRCAVGLLHPRMISDSPDDASTLLCSPLYPYSVLALGDGVGRYEARTDRVTRRDGISCLCPEVHHVIGALTEFRI